jgi:hypothetical protein
MSRNPNPDPVEHKITPTSWWYEEKDGILVVQEARTAGGVHLGVVRTKIPWIALLAAARRLGKLRGG